MTDPGIRTHQLIAGRYRIERELGRGGSAVVYRALDERHDRHVAIKVLHPDLATALGAQRFLREIKLTAGLQHPHIVPIFDSGETDDGLLFYVMPHVEADSLRRELSAVGRLRIDAALRIAREIAGALAYAHERGLIHRDIKPENILFLGGHACLTDFGIARPMRSSGGERLTHHDVIVGTPEYMSPEQGRNYVLDGRSDVYSLACVLYEMLAGVPPFLADTPVDSLRQRFAHTPPPIRTQRPDVPPVLEEVLSRALATSPDERYESARAFGEALEQASTTPGDARAKRTPPARRTPDAKRRRWGWVAVGVASAVVILGAAIWSPTVRGAMATATRGAIDSAAFVVAPVTADSATASQVDALRGALAAWRGLRVLDAARGARALRMVGLRVERSPAGNVAHAALYDAPSGSELREVAVLLAPGVTLADSAASMVAQLLRDPAAPAADDGVDGTHSYAALLAYQRGHAALERFELAAADSGFSRATQLDPEFAAAQAWLAQTMVWERTGGWEEHARRAAAARSELAGDDSLTAEALEAMRVHEAPRACATYRARVAADSTDTFALLGLGDCAALDSVVIADRSSPSGWSFRGGVYSAMKAYDRAVRVDPRAYAALPVGFLRGLLRTGAMSVRGGHRMDAPGWYLGSPIMVHDTIGYYAFSTATAGGLHGGDRSLVTLDDALRWNRETLLRYLTAQSMREPRSVDALEGVSSVLEERGALLDAGSAGGMSALSALDSAVRLATDPAVRARIGASRVRVLIKAGEFRRARLAADSVLADTAGASPDAASSLATVAEVVGRAALAERMMDVADRPDQLGPEAMPQPVRIASRSLTVRAALGICNDSLRSDLRALDALLDSYVEPKARAAVGNAALYRPVALSVPCLGPQASLALAAASDPLVAMQHALAKHQPAEVRAQLDKLATIRHALRPGDVSLDYVVQEAWVQAAAGDSVGAARRLDLVLDALTTTGPLLLYDIGSAGAVGRAFALRAELATRLHDAATAARWTRAVAELWAEADPAVQHTVSTLGTADRR